MSNLNHKEMWFIFPVNEGDCVVTVKTIHIAASYEMKTQHNQTKHYEIEIYPQNDQSIDTTNQSLQSKVYLYLYLICYHRIRKFDNSKY